MPNGSAVKLVGCVDKRISKYAGEKPAQLLETEMMTHKIYHGPWKQAKVWRTTEI